jgi:ribosomal protein S5
MMKGLPDPPARATTAHANAAKAVIEALHGVEMQQIAARRPTTWRYWLL